MHTPAWGYQWNQLGKLYQHFYACYGSHSLCEQQSMLRDSVAALCDWVATLPEPQLFEPGQRLWATTAAEWPLWKWIHMNTVAPFTNFRVKIRRWKRQELSGKAD